MANRLDCSTRLVLTGVDVTKPTTDLIDLVLEKYG